MDNDSFDDKPMGTPPTLRERLMLLSGMPRDSGDPKPLPIRHDIAILADVLGDTETRYGRRAPLTVSKANPTGGVTVTFRDVAVDDVLSSKAGAKLAVDEIVVKGPIETWPAQIMNSVFELSELQCLIDFLKEARANSAARKSVMEWLRQQMGPNAPASITNQFPNL